MNTKKTEAKGRGRGMQSCNLEEGSLPCQTPRHMAGSMACRHGDLCCHCTGKAPGCLDTLQR